MRRYNKFGAKNINLATAIDENGGERKNPSANSGVCVLASVWVHVCVCVRGVGVCMQFHVLIYVNWKKLLGCHKCIWVSSCICKSALKVVCFVALRPKSTAMVIAGRSVHLTTLFPGQA